MPGEIAHRLPRRRVRDVDIVEQHRQRRPPRDVAEQAGEPLQQPGQRWIALRDRATNEGHPVKQAREIVEQASAQLDHLVVGERAKEGINRLGPQAEGSAGRERIRLRDQSGHLAMASQQLAPEPALADPGLAQQQHDAELSGHRPAELIFERRRAPRAAQRTQSSHRDIVRGELPPSPPHRLPDSSVPQTSLRPSPVPSPAPLERELSLRRGLNQPRALAGRWSRGSGEG